MASKPERLAEIIRRLRAASPAHDHASAFAPLEDIITEVEDELSGIPHDPGRATMRVRSTRMYPPREDSERASPVPGTRCFATFLHDVFIAPNGAMLIRERPTGRVELSKPGDDGNEITP